MKRFELQRALQVTSSVGADRIVASLFWVATPPEPLATTRRIDARAAQKLSNHGRIRTRRDPA
jgi:hypothetical protein